MPEPSSEDANPSARSRLQRARRRFGQTADLNCLAEALALGEIAPGDDKDFRLDRLWELEEYAYAVDAVLCRPFLIDSFVASYPAWRRRLNMVIELLRAWCLDSSLPAQALAFCLDARSSYDQNGTGASIADILEAWANHCAFLWVAQPPDASESAALDLRILQAASRSLRLRLQQYGIPQNPYDMLKRVRNREPAVIPDHYAKELATLIEACRNALHKLADTHETLSMHTWRFTALLEYRLTPSDVDEIIQVTRRGARAPNSPIHFRFTNASHNALWITMTTVLRLPDDLLLMFMGQARQSNGTFRLLDPRLWLDAAGKEAVELVLGAHNTVFALLQEFASPASPRATQLASVAAWQDLPAGLTTFTLCFGNYDAALRELAFGRNILWKRALNDSGDIARTLDDVQRPLWAPEPLTPASVRDILEVIEEDVAVGILPHAHLIMVIFQKGFPPQALWLLGISSTLFKGWEDELTEALDCLHDDRPADDAIKDVLGKLWDSIAVPFLSVVQPSGKTKRRVHWCLGGPLSRLPIHAASDRLQGRSLLDDFVSSYTTSFEKLVAARRTLPARSSANSPRLTIALADAASLGNISTEGHRLARRFAGAVPAPLILGGSGNEVTARPLDRQTFLASLSDKTWLHFAGHAHQSSGNNPFRSYIRISSEEKITLDDIAELRPKGRLKHGSFAFLSACEVGKGSLRVPDESLHVASAMQEVGFDGVIGTLWKISDDAAAEVAERFYDALGPQLQPTQAAAALNAAQCAMKESGRLDWLGHVHFGV